MGEVPDVLAKIRASVKLNVDQIKQLKIDLMGQARENEKCFDYQSKGKAKSAGRYDQLEQREEYNGQNYQKCEQIIEANKIERPNSVHEIKNSKKELQEKLEAYQNTVKLFKLGEIPNQMIKVKQDKLNYHEISMKIKIKKTQKQAIQTKISQKQQEERKRMIKELKEKQILLKYGTIAEKQSIHDQKPNINARSDDIQSGKIKEKKKHKRLSENVIQDSQTSPINSIQLQQQQTDKQDVTKPVNLAIYRSQLQIQQQINSASRSGAAENAVQPMTKQQVQQELNALLKQSQDGVIVSQKPAKIEEEKVCKNEQKPEIVINNKKGKLQEIQKESNTSLKVEVAEKQEQYGF